MAVAENPFGTGFDNTCALTRLKTCISDESSGTFPAGGDGEGVPDVLERGGAMAQRARCCSRYVCSKLWTLSINVQRCGETKGEEGLETADHCWRVVQREVGLVKHPS